MKRYYSSKGHPYRIWGSRSNKYGLCQRCYEATAVPGLDTNESSETSWVAQKVKLELLPLELPWLLLFWLCLLLLPKAEGKLFGQGGYVGSHSTPLTNTNMQWEVR